MSFAAALMTTRCHGGSDGGAEPINRMFVRSDL